MGSIFELNKIIRNKLKYSNLIVTKIIKYSIPLTCLKKWFKSKIINILSIFASNVREHVYPSNQYVFQFRVCFGPIINS